MGNPLSVVIKNYKPLVVRHLLGLGSEGTHD